MTSKPILPFLFLSKLSFSYGLVIFFLLLVSSVTKADSNCTDLPKVLKASNAGADDRFGASLGFTGRGVALQGDVMVVGANGEDSDPANIDPTNNDLSNSGAVYVFRCIDTGGGVFDWVEEALLKTSDAGVGHFFGHPLAISGDVIAVGAFGVDDFTKPNPIDVGAFYVFRYDAGAACGKVWCEEAKLVASNGNGADHFATRAIDISGDVIVVGGPREDSDPANVDPTNNDLSDSGAAYVFRFDAGAACGKVWCEEALLKASNAGASDGFGTSVAVSGNVMVVGPRFEDSDPNNPDPNNNDLFFSGAAYVFRYDAGASCGKVWCQEAFLKASNADIGDFFGFSVDISGDVIVVSGHGERSRPTASPSDNFLTNAGAVYVFRHDAGASCGQPWCEEAFLKASNAGSFDQLGAACVRVDGDVLVATAELEDSDPNNPDPTNNDLPASGAAYVYVYDPTAPCGKLWCQDALFKAPNAGQSDNFGHSCDVSGSEVLIGAENEDGDPANPSYPGTDNDDLLRSGAAYMFLAQDSDGDGIPNSADNCPNVANVNQVDSDGDCPGPLNGALCGDACSTTVLTTAPDVSDFLTCTSAEFTIPSQDPILYSSAITMDADPLGPTTFAPEVGFTNVSFPIRVDPPGSSFSALATMCITFIDPTGLGVCDLDFNGLDDYLVGKADAGSGGLYIDIQPQFPPPASSCTELPGMDCILEDGTNVGTFNFIEVCGLVDSLSHFIVGRDDALSGGPSTAVLCHFPIGNPENWHTIGVSSNAVDAHLAHGDLQGDCTDVIDPLDNALCHVSGNSGKTHTISVNSENINSHLGHGDIFGPCPE